MQAGQAPTFVNPNLDVVYSEAWIAVDEHTPAILEVPVVPAGTYYTAQIVDEWAEITYNVNDRTFPEHPHGTFAICLAGSDPDIPDGAVRLDIPSGKAKLLSQLAAQHRSRRPLGDRDWPLPPQPDVLDGSWTPPAVTTQT